MPSIDEKDISLIVTYDTGGDTLIIMPLYSRKSLADASWTLEAQYYALIEQYSYCVNGALANKWYSLVALMIMGYKSRFYAIFTNIHFYMI